MDLVMYKDTVGVKSFRATQPQGLCQTLAMLIDRRSHSDHFRFNDESGIGRSLRIYAHVPLMQFARAVVQQ